MISLKNLELRNDDNSPYGLAFSLIGETIYAPVLNHDLGNFSSEDIDEETGLPKKLGQGNKSLDTRSDKSGLSGLLLGWDLDLVSDNVVLAGSCGLVRVVVVS